MENIVTLKHIKELGACRAALDWLDVQADNHKTAAQSWNECDNPRWMIWLLTAMGIPMRLILAVMLDIFSLQVEPYLPADTPVATGALLYLRKIADGEPPVEVVTDEILMECNSVLDGIPPDSKQCGALNAIYYTLFLFRYQNDVRRQAAFASDALMAAYDCAGTSDGAKSHQLAIIRSHFPTWQHVLDELPDSWYYRTGQILFVELPRDTGGTGAPDDTSGSE
jgi:hypothetical protein